MHRLVQLSFLKWLEMQNEKLKWQEGVLRLLSANFSGGNGFETWGICALYLPHILIVIGGLVLGLDHVNELGLLVDTASYGNAETIQSGRADLKTSVETIRKGLPSTETSRYSDTLRRMTVLGVILNYQGE